MPEEWLSVAQAAATMKVHPRTIERRMVAGKIESRRNDDGQVVVLVTVPESVEPISSEAFETVRDLANQQVDIAAGSASALVRVAQEQTLRAENQLVLARQDAGRYRRETRFALVFATCVLLAVIGGVGWCTYAITQAHADALAARTDAQQKSDIAAHAAEDAHSALAAVNVERDRLDTAVIARARAEGQLDAYKSELADVVQMTHKRPATQPANLVQRISQAFAGD